MSAQVPTPEELALQVAVLARASGRDEEDIRACSPQELADLATVYRDAVRGADKTALDVLGAFLAVALQVAPGVTTLAGAVSAVEGVVQAAKSPGG